MKRVVILGLDCATPQLVFDKWREYLPSLSSIMDRGTYAKLRSTIPPITVPAWTAMMTSKDPGMLGFYGFRNREAYDYKSLYFANANFVKSKTVWNWLSRSRMASLVFGVPQTYPPKPLNGVLVSSFLAPGKDVPFTWPHDIRPELDKAAGGDYMIDVDEFRTEDKDKLLEDIYRMTEARWKAFRHFYKKGDYPFAIVVEMGVDRIHHGFWRFFDTEHRLYQPGNKYENAVLDYYVYLDREIGKTLELFDKDTLVMVVSDHGAKRMNGAICINEWLQQQGCLALKRQPKEPTRLSMDMVDWENTKVWGEGGYYARIFMNVEGREPEGQVPEKDYHLFRDELKEKLEALTDEKGVNIGTRVFKPEEVYKEINNIAPDLIAYLGDLDWRSAGSVGTGTVHMFENDTGPDDANHAQDGILICNRPPESFQEINDVYSIYDLAPTVLSFLGVQVPADMIGRNLLKQ